VIDGTREGEVDTGYELRVEDRRERYFSLVIVEGMGNGERYLKVELVD